MDYNHRQPGSFTTQGFSLSRDGEFTHTHTRLKGHVFIYVCVKCIYIYIIIYKYIYIYMYTYIIYVYIYIYIHIYIYTWWPSDKQGNWWSMSSWAGGPHIGEGSWHHRGWPGLADKAKRNGTFSVKVIYSYGHLPVLTGYKWDYTFYKWGYKYL